MLPLIISCTRSWNFWWHFFGRSTTESKNIVKLLAISQTIHTVCCEGDYFPKAKFKLFNSLLHSVYLVFPKSLFSIATLFAVRCLWVICNEDKCCVVTQCAADIPVAWLVYVCTYCLPMLLWIKTSELDYSIWVTPPPKNLRTRPTSTPKFTLPQRLVVKVLYKSWRGFLN